MSTQNVSEKNQKDKMKIDERHHATTSSTVRSINLPRAPGVSLTLTRKGIRHVMLLDFDNVPDFFRRCDHAAQELCGGDNPLPFLLPPGTFIWCFNNVRLRLYDFTVGSTCFYDLLRHHDVEFDMPAAMQKNSADTALALCVGKLGAICPKGVPFTVISEDRSFDELVRRKGKSRNMVRFTRYLSLEEHKNTHLDFFAQLYQRLVGKPTSEAKRYTEYPYCYVNYDSRDSVNAQVRHAVTQIHPSKYSRHVTQDLSQKKPNLMHF